MGLRFLWSSLETQWRRKRTGVAVESSSSSVRGGLMLLIAASWVDEEFQLGCGEDQGTSIQSTSSCVVGCGCCLLLAADFVEEESGYGSNRAGPSNKVQAIIIFASKYEQPILYVQACHK